MCDHSIDLAAMMRAVCAFAMLALAGCGGAVPGAAPPFAVDATPRTAILYRDTVTVQFSDGALCAAKRPGAARVWSGRLAGCPHLLPYEVTLPAGPMAPRRVLVRLSGGGMPVIAVQTAAFGLPGPA